MGRAGGLSSRVPPASRRLGERLVAPPDPWAGVLALMFWAASLTPTLLPRSTLIQGALTGVLTVVGYGIGGLAVGALRAIRAAPRLRGATRWMSSAARARRALVVAELAIAALLLVGGMPLWLQWQNGQRTLVGLDHLGARAMVNTALIAAALAAALMMICRLVAAACGALDRLLWRRVGPLWSRIGVAVAFAAVLALFVSQVLIEGVYGGLRDHYAAGDKKTEPGIYQPTGSLQSGGPGSLTPWDTLGLQGRTFAGSATPVSDLAQFAGDGVPVLEPIRVYVGLDTAPTPQERADLALRELQRTGAFARRVLVIGTATGTGWINPRAASAIEYMWHGDSAFVAQQYSYLPSWITFLAGKKDAGDAARALIGAVAGYWATLPIGQRPELVFFGESLGSYGAEEALAGGTLPESIAALDAEDERAFFVGPTQGNPVWRQLQGDRAAGSPVWRPVDPDGLVQTATSNDELPEGGSPGPTVQYLAHGTDPVTWWGWSCLLYPPEWITGPAAPGLPSQVVWFPIVTWLQTVTDLFEGFGTDPGFGHNYDDSFARGFAAVAAPPGWTAADTDRLAELLSQLNEIGVGDDGSS